MNGSRALLSSVRGIVGGPLLVAIGLLVLGASSASGYEFGLTTSLCIDIIALVGLNLIAGHAGQLVLGHAGLIAAGAYTVLIAGTEHGMSGPVSLLLAVVLSAVVAVVIGIPTLRLRGLYFSVGTLAFAVIIDFLSNRAVSLTGGPDGKLVDPLIVGTQSYADPEQFFYLTVAVTVVVLVFERSFVRTWVAWGLRAARASEPAAASAGVPIFSARLGTFALAGALAGLAGALLAYQTQYVSPSSFTLQESIDLFVVLYIGGSATFLGPVAGAFLLYVFDRWLSPYPDLKPFVLGVLFLLALRFLPGGLGGALNTLWARWRRRPPAPPATTPPGGTTRDAVAVEAGAAP